MPSVIVTKDNLLHKHQSSIPMYPATIKLRIEPALTNTDVGAKAFIQHNDKECYWMDEETTLDIINGLLSALGRPERM